MSHQCFYILLCVVVFVTVKAEKRKENRTEITGRTARFGSEIFENRLPSTDFQDRYYDSAAPYPEFSDRTDRYFKDKPLPYEIPTGFDQFVPDKDNGAKDSYGPGGFYLPYLPNFRPNYPEAEIEETNKVTTSPAVYKNDFSIKDVFLKVLRYFIGNNDPDSVLFDEKPSLLSAIKQLLKDPAIALTAIVVPLSFFMSTVIPFFAKMFMKSSIMPALTSTIANTVARSFESPAAEEIIDAINEFGARAINDPRCVQRILCQAAKSHIESRSGDSWSAQRIIRKLAKAVDGKLWDALGMKIFFNSLQNGHCENLPCSEDIPYTADLPVMEKLRAAFSKLLNYTATELM